MKKVFLAVLSFFILLLPNTAYSKNPDTKPPSISSRYVSLIDFESGRVLYEKNSDIIVPMASTTKIMTAIIALENSSFNDIVTVSKKASSIYGSTVGLKEGENISMEELIYGLMLSSGNDCAIAIAEHISGSVERFASLMNSKAFDIGAFNTHFVSPHGLDSNGHFTTAHDLALITRYAYKNETFKRIVSTKSIVFKKRSFYNTNKLLGSIDGVDGVKTGYTGKAGRCLVSSMYKNGRRYICVVLNSSNRWQDSKKLFEYAVNNYKSEIKLDSKKLKTNVNVTGGTSDHVLGGFESDILVPLSDSEKNNLSYKVILPDNINAPVYKGQQLGRFILYYENKEIYTVPYIALESIEISKTKSLIERIFKR